MSAKLAFASLMIFVSASAARADTITVELKKLPDPAAVSYSQVKPLFTASCAICHTGSTPPAGLNLSAFPFTSTRMADQQMIVDTILTRVTSTLGRMPPSAMPALTADQVNLLKAWRASGLPSAPVMKYETIVKVIAADGSVKGSETFSASASPFDTGFTYQLNVADAPN